MTADLTSPLDRAEAELAHTLEDPARSSSLSYEQSAAVVAELRALRAQVNALDPTAREIPADELPEAERKFRRLIESRYHEDDFQSLRTLMAEYDRRGAELERLREAPSADQVRGAVGWLLDYYSKPRSPWSDEEDQTDAARRLLGDELAEKLIGAFSRLAELEPIEQRAREMSTWVARVGTYGQAAREILGGAP